MIPLTFIGLLKPFASFISNIHPPFFAVRPITNVKGKEFGEIPEQPAITNARATGNNKPLLLYTA